MASNTTISADELNNKTLLTIFQNAYIEAKEDKDGDIVVETESKNFIYLEFLKITDLIHLSAFFNISKEASKDDIFETHCVYLKKSHGLHLDNMMKKT